MVVVPMTDLTPEDLDEGEKLLSAATPCPWDVDARGVGAPDLSWVCEFVEVLADADAIVWLRNNGEALIATAMLLELQKIEPERSAVMLLEDERDALKVEVERLTVMNEDLEAKIERLTDETTEAWSAAEGAESERDSLSEAYAQALDSLELAEKHSDEFAAERNALKVENKRLKVTGTVPPGPSPKPCHYCGRFVCTHIQEI